MILFLTIYEKQVIFYSQYVTKNILLIICLSKYIKLSPINTCFYTKNIWWNDFNPSNHGNTIIYHTIKTELWVIGHINDPFIQVITVMPCKQLAKSCTLTSNIYMTIILSKSCKVFNLYNLMWSTKIRLDNWI